MNKFLPDIYKKDIYSIDYKKLKEMGIKLLVFDFDNTIVEKDKKDANSDMISLFSNLKKDFDIIVLSNTLKNEKINNVCSKCGIKFIKGALKPLSFGYKKIKGYDSSAIATIGDQLLTDILGAKKMGYLTILVDPIGKDNNRLTFINRLIEVKLYKNLKDKYNFEKGKYYD